LVARTAMAAPATVQREAVAAATAVIAVRIALRLILLRLRLLRLAPGNKGRQAVDVLIAGWRRRVLRPRLKMLLLLWLLLRLVMVLLRRLVLLLASIERLRLARCERLAGQVRLLVVVAVEAIVADIAAHIALLLLVEGLALPVLLLGGGDQAEIMLGVLVVIFGRDRIAGTLRIAGELKVFFGDVRGRAADFNVRSTGLVHTGQRILVMTTFAVATPHALVLTVSHGLLFCQPPFCSGYMPPLLTKALLRID
jgi:hypothetical protein